MRHITGSVYAVFDEAGADVPRHDHGRASSATRRGTIPKRGFVGGYEMETLSLGLPFLAAFLDPGAWGREFTSALDSYDNMAGMWIVGEDMPQREEPRSRSTPTVKDEYGMPVAERPFRRSPERRRHAQPRLSQGAALYEAVGATRTFPTPPYPSTHNLGTNRMSEKPRDGVVNKLGQTHDIGEPVRLGRQPVHHRRRREPDAHHRVAGDPAGRLHRQADVGGQHLRRAHEPTGGAGT